MCFRSHTSLSLNFCGITDMDVSDDGNPGKLLRTQLYQSVTFLFS